MIQTHTIRHFPVILVGSAEWYGLLDWLDRAVITLGQASPADADLLHRVDQPEEICALIEAACSRQRRAASARAASA